MGEKIGHRRTVAEVVGRKQRPWERGREDGATQDKGKGERETEGDLGRSFGSEP